LEKIPRGRFPAPPGKCAALRPAAGGCRCRLPLDEVAGERNRQGLRPASAVDRSCPRTPHLIQVDQQSPAPLQKIKDFAFAGD
jgi:hypothetical protein